ncbi:MAG: amidohydrolase family protein [Elusimicrobia bacterium]|nr:amidohydrolase family protein [Elusimicrobiota bacterium]
MIIDFHTHAFPDDIAERAMSKLAYKSHLTPSHDGTISGLIKSMDNAGIAKSIICTIATKPSQSENILKWCLKIKSERIIPFASIHPENDSGFVKKIASSGISGIKLHPMYQKFFADDERMFPIYGEIEKEGLILIFHSGFDIAFPADERASVERILKVAEKFPGLKIIASHTGGWKMWDRVLRLLAGEDIWLEISMTLKYIDAPERFYQIIKKHSPDRILFGTDAPWGNQSEDAGAVRKLSIAAELKEKIFSENALSLLGG